ncbi:thermonuclease family protein [Lacisediminihabitans sp. G11-30]|uniref:Thermonuclease family protein n=2 Tax=Lacisediminihabitans changchengi TaxID=2787634 RepID=A0A934W3H4_9MICO|nr:thermonuclease family protein [Lacisediminihabitans changchengi]
MDVDAGPAPSVSSSALAVTDHGEVTHLVDGDTLDVSIAGVTTRIRLLNIDTPETVKPDSPVECMGPQASARLAQLAPPGSTVGLAYDVERTDRYGRTLAMVITPDGGNASEILAREGLGVAVEYGANVAGYDAIMAAERQARDANVGLYSGACG